MSQDQKFQQRWQFRRREDDFDSSSNDSKSSSSGEPVLKKHKLVSNLILPENNENINIPRSRQKDLLDPGMGAHFEFGKANKMHIGSSNKSEGVKNKTKRNSTKEGNKKKRKQSHEPDSMDDFKVFMESILEELKVARESMFARMREEMKKLIPIESASRPTIEEAGCVRKLGLQQQNSIESGMKTQKCNVGSLDRSGRSNVTAASNNCPNVLEKQVNHAQATGTTTPNEKDQGEERSLSVKKPIYSFHQSDQLVSSSYLTLPSVLSEAQIENQRNDSSSRNYSQPGVAGNDTSMNSERANLITDANAHHGHFSGIQQDEQFGNFAQIGSRSMGYFDHQVTGTSGIDTGFPIPLHQGRENSFNIPSQVVLDNSFRGNNILGLRTNKGSMRFSGASHSLPEHFVANNLRGHMK
ncbi:unnamed protein product [Ilex paraguariensis]|uniref:Uncharacterized protein n=1 Tax=Ilex paraguariensis TaxID=185542 RepID=A0ABC8SKM2_9AQUA